MNLTKIECCNTCQHSRLKYNSPLRICVVDTSPYGGYLGGNDPSHVCDRFEPVEWLQTDSERKE